MNAKRKRWLIAATVALLALFGAGFAASRVPEPLFSNDYSKMVLAEDGRILRVFLNQKEQWILPPLGEPVPDKLKTAVIHYEDKRFESHWGIDPLALLRALWQNIFRGERISGASTITMQVARLIKPKPRTVRNKLVEMAQALRLELRYSKAEILKLYLTHAPYGGNIQGYRAASLRYFGLEPARLSWAQAATLAVLPNNPAYVNPMRNPQALKKKRDGLLNSLLEAQIIDAETYLLAVSEEVPDSQLVFPLVAPHLAERLALGAEENVLWTTLNWDLQARAEALVRAYAEQMGRLGVQNAAALIADTQSGHVKAYVASQDYFDDANLGKIDGVRMRRSTGSTLKPFLYALAMDEGLIVRESVLLDIPTTYAGYAPYNADHSFSGIVRADTALIRSLNVPTVQLLHELGVEKFFKFLQKAGLEGIKGGASEHGLSLVLGSASASLWELASLYRGLGNYGQFGGLAVLAEQPQAQTQLLSAGSSYLILETIKEVARPKADYFWQEYQSAAPLAWKTGTSYGGCDAWAVGVSPQWTIAVWAGNFTGGEVKGLSGIDSAAPLLFQLFGALDKDARRSWFVEPKDDLASVQVSAQTGYRLLQGWENQVKAAVSASALPLRYSPYEKTLFVNLRETMEVCSLCWDRSDLMEVERVVYPPLVNVFLRQRGLEYVVPPHNPQCPAAQRRESPIRFVYPQANSRIFVPKVKTGEYQKVNLEAAHSHKDSTLFWYLDNSYLGTTNGQHQLDISLETGWHSLYVIDEVGNEHQISFYSERSS